MKRTAKKRLDILLVEKGLCPSRERAKAVIMAGQVYVDNQKTDKVGTDIPEGAQIELRGETLKYVSRGGLKLEKAMSVFPISLAGKICMDIGASTGGFTDCMLQNGAARVYAVDVGYGQLAWSLRTDERVINMERTNIRAVTREQIADVLDFISIDVSFISLRLVLPVAAGLLTDSGELICLVKPQFEAGREKVGKKGVVRERKTHIEVLENAAGYARDSGFSVCGVDFSPVKGPEGNIEYLLYLKKQGEDTVTAEQLTEAVEASHNALDSAGKREENAG